MVLRVKLTVGFAADFAYCLIPAGFLTTDVVGDYLSADITFVIFILIGTIIRFDAFRTAVCRALAGVCAIAV